MLYSAPVAEVIPLSNDRLALVPINFDEDVLVEIGTSTLISNIFGPAAPVMTRVFECESGMDQWDDLGRVILSRTNDVGISQINLTVWEDKALELGYDLFTTEGNLKMAKYILDHSGLRAWTCARNGV